MNFTYRAIERDGGDIDGRITASNKNAAIKVLQEKGLIILDVTPEKARSFLDIEIGTGIKQRDLVILTRQLAVLFNASISAHRVFHLLGEQTEKPQLREVVETVSNDVQRGASISQAMSKHPKIFDSFYINIIAVGEETGTLSRSFSYLANYLDRNFLLTKKAKKALTYPIFVVSMFFIVIGIILIFVIPQIETILVDSGQELPASTQFVLGLSNIFVNHWLIVLAALLTFFVLFLQYVRTRDGQYVFHGALLSLPIIGPLFKKLSMARFADNLQVMLDSGVPMLRSLNNVAKVVKNRVYEDIINESADRVKRGQSLSSALSRYDQVPRIVPQMVKVGEESGKLPSILGTLASFYIREAENAIDTMISLIEPALIIVLGFGVGFIIASVLLPIYSISTSI